MTDKLTPEQIDLLNQPLAKANVKQRKNYGGGGSLSYLESHHVIREANRIFGYDGWSSETVQIERVATTPYSNKGRDMIAVSYMARVRVTAGGAVREGCGYGDGQGAVDKAGAAHELAIKEAESDARKRALMTFGDPFGLALYDKAQSNVADVVRRSKADSDDDYKIIQQGIDDAATMQALGTFWQANWPIIQTMHIDYQDMITQRKDDKKHDLNKQAA